MANAFSKEERVAFEDILEGFHDYLILSKAVSVYNVNDTMLERARNTIWRPMPYILDSVSGAPGTDISAAFQDANQLSVPISLGYTPTVPWQLTISDLRDGLQQNRLTKAAYQRLASDVNVAVMNVAANQGTLVVPVATAPGTYNDVALCDSIMNEQGVAKNDRWLALSSRSYNGMAGDLAVATRSFTSNPKSGRAYEDSYVGPVAGFQTLKLDYANRIRAATTAGTIATNGAQVRYVPQATSNAVGGQINVDNRYQTVTVSATASFAAGDCFTIAGIEAVHQITKQSTGQLKTFRVISVVDGTTMVISPPMIGANSSPTDAEIQYQNVFVASTSGTATITKLNVDAADINPFWHQDAIEILPGRYAPPTDAGASILTGTLDNGISVQLVKQYVIGTNTVSYRVDTFFGVGMVNPEMAGILLFSQTP